MTLAADPTHDALLADFERLQRQHHARPGSEALHEFRQRAMERFLALGFPTLKHEEWRQTSLRPLIEAGFTVGPGEHEATTSNAAQAATQAVAPASALTSLDVMRLRPAGLTGPMLVFVDGRFRADLSSPVAEQGLSVTNLALALRDEPARTLDALDEQTDPEEAFSALNSAFLLDGPVIAADSGARPAGPVYLLHIATPDSTGHVCHPRGLIRAGAGSALDIVEHFVAWGEVGASWSNAVTEIALEPDAKVCYHLIESQDLRAFHTATLAVRQERGSRFEAHTGLLGGGLVRHNLRIELAGEGCDSLINGLFVPRGRQHLDNHMRVVHAAPSCTSRQTYHGIVNDQARGLFTGRIIVRPGAQKTDARQSSRNLVLSEGGRIDVQPQLEIYADDVKCTHGATTGRLDEQAIFYLRSRGIDAGAARAMLVYAFAQECLARVPLEPVRRALEAELLRRLPHPELLRGLTQNGEASP